MIKVNYLKFLIKKSSIFLGLNSLIFYCKDQSCQILRVLAGTFCPDHSSFGWCLQSSPGLCEWGGRLVPTRTAAEIQKSWETGEENKKNKSLIYFFMSIKSI